MGTIRVLSGAQIREAVQIEDIIAAVRDAFIGLSAGSAEMPIRSHISIADPQGEALFMPSYMKDFDRIGIKTVTLFEDNRLSDIPYIQGLVSVYDGQTGCPQAVLDGTTITAMRTGAASGLATDLLARQDSKICAILGAGVQGRTQLEAVCAVRDIERVFVYDTIKKAAHDFAKSMGDILQLELEVVDNPRQAIHQADIICCATISKTPVFDDTDCANGTHINAVGSYKPHVQEIPEETVLRSRLFVDHFESALEETGDLIIPIGKGLFSKDHIIGEIGEVAAEKKVGRTASTEITLFKSVGVAVQDLAAASTILQYAEKRNVGSVVQF